jgi:hypothetical protein
LTDEPSAAGCRLWRQDDNGNCFLVASHESRSDADRELARLAQGAHKQLYWIETAPRGRSR